MKKRIFILILAIATALGLAAVASACGGNGETVDYSVTVLAPDESPLSDVDVTWKFDENVAGTAKTGSDGTATASLVAGTYTIALDNFGAGYAYTAVSVTSSMRSIEITLSVARVNYSVTVTDKSGAAASNVTVNWTKGSTIAGTAKTGADGKASCELDYGDYSVTLADLPSGNVYDGAKTASGSNPALEFALRDGVTVPYCVTVRSEGGLIFKDHSVSVYSGSTLLASGRTDDDGKFDFNAAAGDYSATTVSLPDGYKCTPVNLTSTAREAELVLSSEVIKSAPAGNLTYVIGDIIHDYSFRTPYMIDNKIWSGSVSEILKEKEILIINNWGTQCYYCVDEMPAMQEIYEKYSDQIEIVGVSNYRPADTDDDIISHQARYGITFPLMRDKNGFATKFNITGWPTTVIVDRYGAIARIEVGAVTSAEAWEKMIKKYIGPDYVQTFTPGDRVSDSINDEISKPDVTIPENHYETIAAVLNKTATFPNGASVVWRGETEYEYAWPFVVGTVEGVSPQEQVVYSSNSGKASTMSIIYATVTVNAGKVLTFDYYSDTEEDRDELFIVWDGKIIKQISGNSQGWQTCYLYTDLTDGSHSLALTYRKNSNKNVGKDNVYLRNVRFEDLSVITSSTNMLRAAAYGKAEEGAKLFPYYAGVELNEDDGYYHVKLDTLHNNTLAGNDESPLLLVNLLNVTNWDPYFSISQRLTGVNESGYYAHDCTFTINGVTRDYREDLLRYVKAAQASDVPDFAPVDEFLHDMLVQFMKKVSGTDSHDKEWLEACYFYSHYGNGKPVGNPIMGLLTSTAIVAVKDTEYTADLTRDMYPFPTMIYSFTPETSAVYRMESLIPDADRVQYSSQIWLFDDNSNEEKPILYCGDTRLTLGGVNEHNFVIHRYLEAGHTYYIEVAFQMQMRGQLTFKITEVGQTATDMLPCSDDIYNMVLDKDGNITDQIELANPIEYVLGEDGYYHVKNSDGTAGDFIYLDVLNAGTSALGTVPLNKLIDKFVRNPETFADLDYKMFDFRYCIIYRAGVDSSGAEIITYNAKVDISDKDEAYKDYTEILRQYIEDAPTEGEYKGLIKVNQELVDILTMYFELRQNSIFNDIENKEPALENEWLRFCWYKRVYSQTNP